MERRGLNAPINTQKIRLFCSDLDGTLVGNPEASRRFAKAWLALEPAARPKLVYSSGRLLQQSLEVISQSGLPKPDYVIAGVGTEIFDITADTVFEELAELLDPSWDREKVDHIVSHFPGVTPQPPEFLSKHKSSWYFHRASPAEIDLLRTRLLEAGLQVTVVYSSLRDLDVLPKTADKGNALSWLLARLGISPSETLVAGDSGNDSSMFLLDGVRGIAVENAHPDLYEAIVRLPVYCASAVLADGVLEGLKHFGVIGAVPPPSAGVAPQTAHNPALARLADSADVNLVSPSEVALINEGYRRAVEALKKNITPLGFSACSMADNDVVGTDVNYRSVWARDGAITILFTRDLDDRLIREAQRNTLMTLFDALSSRGQVPANVRIDDGVPDYSGVGGVCAIDAPLWAVIAFHAYVRATGELELLERYAGALERAMDWVGAHDGNNNGLLEIPEAGDWTDLFGRSYEVLYDEVLWYRAQVCYARLLELRKDYDAAAEYHRCSQRTRSALLGRFWPSTNIHVDHGPRSFADQQFSVGDARYLLAEITPFNFNWRCDVIGNVLAFLFGVLDVERAQIAFRFMWGVGVNQPYPVANLYPVVQSGDPDWKPYYIVNLQNLPHHYHNGGIWPFIGGMWVRFVQRLGLHDLACRELHRLASANREGKVHEWEFNEWLHGGTGRPMGKAYQAWSAASFVRACHELGFGDARKPGGSDDD
jgi:sucrose-6F-phosphate phosphohydrolase